MSVWARTVFAIAAVAAPCCARQPIQPVSSLAALRAGEEFLKQHNFQAAAIEFAAAAKGDRDPAWTVVWSHVGLGRAFDASGQRERAVAEYHLALDTKDNTFGALGFANMYLWKAPAPDDASPSPTNPDSVAGPTVLTRVEPEYSAEGLLARLEGNVTVGVSLDRDGKITGLHVLESLGLGLDEAALAAVRRWTFVPAMLRGQPESVVTPVRVQFRLPSRVPGWHVTKIQFANPDGADRPVLTYASGLAPGKMSPELADEAAIDAAMSRNPNATVSMEIDALGNPGKIHVDAASLPEWGDDAISAISQWKFSPSLQSGTAIAVPCVIELVRFPQ
jgi:TonB family protein